MNINYKFIIFVSLFFINLNIKAQLPFKQKLWDASWISHHDAPEKNYCVLHFRKTFHLQAIPKEFNINVSADNRYFLYVNGVKIGMGPARGDLLNWNYETYNIAAQLHSGENVVAALVYNMGFGAPLAQISNKTGFIVQGKDSVAKALTTNKSWKVFLNKGYSPIYPSVRGYYVAGVCDSVQGNMYPWGWETLNYDDKDWQNAKQNYFGIPQGFGFGADIALKARTIPMPEHYKEEISEIADVSGLDILTGSINFKNPLRIPANTKASILFDQEHLTMGFPTIILSKGKHAKIKISYAEALYVDQSGYKKGNRNEIDGKYFAGMCDIYMQDGGSLRKYLPLWIRTYRYIKLEIDNPSEELLINDLYNEFTAYPFVEKAKFICDDPSLMQVWKTAWRTARLCALETYFDCPYYEQLQYVGDTRIQALISLSVSGDDKLMRNAIEQVQQSIFGEGLTLSRAPTSAHQVIPTFSLLWVSMVHDYWRYRNDRNFIEPYINSIRGILDWFISHYSTLGIPGHFDKYWFFVDWSKSFQTGVPPLVYDSYSSIISLQLLYTLQQAIEIFESFERKELALQYTRVAHDLQKKIIDIFYDKQKELIADTPDKIIFSQHANILGILTHCFNERDETIVMNKILSDSSLSQATIYFKFYLFRALKKANMANIYLQHIDEWHEMLNQGLTTFSEKDPEISRSDCHAWSASPCYDFLATICGIEPESSGFESVIIAPSPGKLTMIQAEFPHPQGMIYFDFNRKENGGISVKIKVPEGLPAKFIWNKKVYPIKEKEFELETY